MLEQVSETLDIVVSNPPYISQSEFDELPVDVKNFEPKTALLAGARGIDVIERLIPQSADRLRPGGHLLLEVSPMIAKSVAELLHGWDNVQILPDSTCRERIVGGQRQE